MCFTPSSSSSHCPSGCKDVPDELIHPYHYSRIAPGASGYNPHGYGVRRDGGGGGGGGGYAAMPAGVTYRGQVRGEGREGGGGGGNGGGGGEGSGGEGKK
ncbi:hypothetical protein ACLMJK_001912 [Lecanora helva]